MVAGCKVLDGHLQKSGGSIRVKRGDEVVHIGGCASLKRHKLDVERVGKGTEFGAVLDGFTTFQQVNQFLSPSFAWSPHGSVLLLSAHVRG